MRTITKKIKKLIFDYRYFSPSFSQAGEDMILRNLFSKIQDGFYVDVGAYHPTIGSNTYFLQRFKGWRGINIEPNPEQIHLFKKARPNDINLNVGISTKSEKLNYYILKKGASTMNSFSLDFLKKIGLENSIEKTVEVQTRPLQDVLKEHLPDNKSIDLLDIDVEGFDLEVLQSNDWDKYRPKSVMVEIDVDGFETSPVDKFLRDLGYKIVAMTPVSTQINMSCIYFDSELYKTYQNYIY